MAKIIAMVPARLGSKRVPRKNLRLLNGRPLIAYAIEAAKKSGAFSDIYLNSEAKIFSGIARELGVKFYKRPESLSSDKTINDEFVLDFIKNIPADILIQIVPTSPLITSAEISGFVAEMRRGGYDTLVSVRNHQIASVFKGRPVNFSLTEPHKSSQEMQPVQSYAAVLMGWTYKSFLENIEKYGCGYHGCKGKTGYYLLKGLSTIDIDNEEDFVLAEVALRYRDRKQQGEKKYYRPEGPDKRL